MKICDKTMLFALQHDLLRISDDGGVDNGTRRIQDPYPAQTEPADCRKAAALVGRWFGKVADASLILAMWGLKP